MGCFSYNAESARRKNNIQKAFGIIFSEMETDGYYNNSLKPSVTKYAVNTLESNFFSKYIAGKMLIKSAFKSILAVVMMVIVGWYASESRCFIDNCTSSFFCLYNRRHGNVINL